MDDGIDRDTLADLISQEGVAELGRVELEGSHPSVKDQGRRRWEDQDEIAQPLHVGL